MKPVPGWKIAAGESSATRTDGVRAAFLFPDNDKPYAVVRGAGEYLKRWSNSKPRLYRTLALAMAAADKHWPVKR